MHQSFYLDCPLLPKLWRLVLWRQQRCQPVARRLVLHQEARQSLRQNPSQHGFHHRLESQLAVQVLFLQLIEVFDGLDRFFLEAGHSPTVFVFHGVGLLGVVMATAYSSELIAAIRSGDPDAFLRGLASTVFELLQLGGSHIQFRDALSVASCVTQGSPEQRGLLAAGCDLYDLMMLAPEGRKALLDLLDKPFLEHAKGE